MSKKNKGFNRDFHGDAPEVLNMDEIRYMPDEAIYSIANRLESERNRLANASRDTRLWEVEIAYLRREQELRHIRAEHHQKYLQKFGSQRSHETMEVVDEGAHEPAELN